MLAELITLCDLDLTDLHLSYKQDLQTLREEFERYKLRAQSVLKSKSSKVCNVTYSYTTAMPLVSSSCCRGVAGLGQREGSGAAGEAER